MRIYATRQDAVDDTIAPSVENTTARYDMQAICEEAFNWDDGAQGFRQAVSEQEYWKIVQKHELPGLTPVRQASTTTVVHAYDITGNVRQVSTTTVVHAYDITGNPPSICQFYGDYQIHPTRVRVTWINGDLDYVRVAGSRIKKDGTPGQAAAHIDFYARRFLLEGPQWLRDLILDAPSIQC